MEDYRIPRERDNTADMGYFALRLVIDEMFANSDAEVFRILNQYIGEQE